MGRRLFYITLMTVLSHVLLALVSANPVGAVMTLSETTLEDYAPAGYMSGMAGHPGELCVSCHTRFSVERPYADELPYNVSNPAVLHIMPCSKTTCHKTPPTKFNPRGTTRWTLHLPICENCHPVWNTSVDTIHNTHLNFSYLLLNRSHVECRFCHTSPQGYNTSVVQVPPWPVEAYASPAGTIYKPKWAGNCSYCHFTIRGAERVHDVHYPVLLNACPICHSSYILDAPNMFDRIDYPYPKREIKPPTTEEKITSIVSVNRSFIYQNRTETPEKTTVLSEFYLYFNEILNSFIKIYKSVI